MSGIKKGFEEEIAIHIVTQETTQETKMKPWIRKSLIHGVILLGLMGCTSYAQQMQSAAYQTISDNFFDMLQQGKASEAVDYMFITNPELIKKIPDQMDNFKAQFSSLHTLMGAYIAHSKLAETKVAGRFVYQHYFVAYERQPISIRIKYYKPGANWVVYALQFDAELSELIQKTTDNNLSLDISK
jgi:hypothetical protein